MEVIFSKFGRQRNLGTEVMATKGPQMFELKSFNFSLSISQIISIYKLNDYSCFSMMDRDSRPLDTFSLRGQGPSAGFWRLRGGLDPRGLAA